MKEHKPAWAALSLAILLGLPALAEAQLFPHLPIKRKRVDPCDEAPVYGQYRQQFWGYYPTCWRRFPPGWGCPSPEAPNLGLIRTEEPIRVPRDLDAPPLDDMPALDEKPAADTATPPELPSERRSPFETPPASPEPGAAAPAETPNRSPFELPPAGEQPGTTPPADMPPAEGAAPPAGAAGTSAPPLTGPSNDGPPPLVPVSSTEAPVTSFLEVPRDDATTLASEEQPLPNRDRRRPIVGLLERIDRRRR